MRYKEEDLARWTKVFLEERGWEIYQEVQPRSGGPIADLVATRGAVLWIIEVKATRSLSLIEQAEAWIPWAHVSIAHPRYKSKRTRYGRAVRADIWQDILSHFGLGLIFPGSDWSVEVLSPRTHRKAPNVRKMRRALCEEHKTFAEAGNSSGRHWSPWRKTLAEAGNYVRNHTGCTVSELVRSIPHHYSSDASARRSLALWALNSEIPGVRLEAKGKERRLFPVEGRKA